MARVGLLGSLVLVVVACGVGSLSESERLWCQDDYFAVYRAGEALREDLRAWTEGTGWALAERPEYIRACRVAYEAR